MFFHPDLAPTDQAPSPFSLSASLLATFSLPSQESGGYLRQDAEDADEDDVMKDKEDKEDKEDGSGGGSGTNAGTPEAEAAATKLASGRKRKARDVLGRGRGSARGAGGAGGGAESYDGNNDEEEDVVNSLIKLRQTPGRVRRKCEGGDSVPFPALCPCLSFSSIFVLLDTGFPKFGPDPSPCCPDISCLDVMFLDHQGVSAKSLGPGGVTSEGNGHQIGGAEAAAGGENAPLQQASQLADANNTGAANIAAAGGAAGSGSEGSAPAGGAAGGGNNNGGKNGSDSGSNSPDENAGGAGGGGSGSGSGSGQGSGGSQSGGSGQGSGGGGR